MYNTEFWKKKFIFCIQNSIFVSQKSSKDAKIKRDVEDVKKAMYLYRSTGGDFCLGMSSCSIDIWVNYQYPSPPDAVTAVNNLKPFLKIQYSFDPEIGLSIRNKDTFYVFSLLNNSASSTPPYCKVSIYPSFTAFYTVG